MSCPGMQGNLTKAINILKTHSLDRRRNLFKFITMAIYIADKPKHQIFFHRFVHNDRAPYAHGINIFFNAPIAPFWDGEPAVFGKTSFKLFRFNL